MKKNILKLLLVVSTLLLLEKTIVIAREKHIFPSEFYAKRQVTVETHKESSILAVHPDDIYWTDISSESGGLIDYAYQMKVCNDALYVLGEEAASGYAAIGRYTKKDGWSIVCDIDVGGSLWTFSVDGDNIYIGGNFTTAGPKQIPARNIVRYSIKSKGWYPMGDGLWDPKNPNVANIIQVITPFNNYVYIAGSFTHTGDKFLVESYSTIWDGDKYIYNTTNINRWSILLNNILYYFDFGKKNDPKDSMILYWGTSKWDGVHPELNNNGSMKAIDLISLGVVSGSGFGIDSKNNYYFYSDYQYKSTTDSTEYIYGTYFTGLINNSLKLLGGKNGSFNEIYYADLVYEVDGEGQVFVAGNFKKGIGDNVLSFKRQGIVVWNGVEWTTMGNGIRDGVSTICYYDGDVYVGGGFGTAGDKPTNGFAKWNKRMVSDVQEQPLATIPEVRLSPNPASEHITIELEKESTDCRIDIYDLYGSCVGTYNISGGRSTIGTDNLSSGVYTLRVQYGNKTASKTIAIIK